MATSPDPDVLDARRRAAFSRLQELEAHLQELRMRLLAPPPFPSRPDEHEEPGGADVVPLPPGAPMPTLAAAQFMGFPREELPADIEEVERLWMAMWRYRGGDRELMFQLDVYRALASTAGRPAPQGDRPDLVYSGGRGSTPLHLLFQHFDTRRSRGAGKGDSGGKPPPEKAITRRVPAALRYLKLMWPDLAAPLDNETFREAALTFSRDSGKSSVQNVLAKCERGSGGDPGEAARKAFKDFIKASPFLKWLRGGGDAPTSRDESGPPMTNAPARHLKRAEVAPPAPSAKPAAKAGPRAKSAGGSSNRPPKRPRGDAARADGVRGRPRDPVGGKVRP